MYTRLGEVIYVVGVILDQSKAFDTLEHTILLYKLENLKIRGLPLMLFQSYLDCRKQAVNCNQNCSPLNTIYNGVYLNDLVNTSTKVKFAIYADDNILLLKNRNIDSLHTNIMSEIDNAKLW